MDTGLKTRCGICPAGCGVEVVSKDGRLDRIRSLKGHPLGIVCPRGATSRDIVYSEDCLKYPQMRAGEKGEGKFQRISWEQALDTVASRLKEIKEKYGARAVGEYSGRGGGSRGKVPFYALVTSGIAPGVVEANVNYLTDHENRDAISGFPVYKAMLCEVRKISLDRKYREK